VLAEKIFPYGVQLMAMGMLSELMMHKGDGAGVART
jgi:hypothetical protein